MKTESLKNEDIINHEEIHNKESCVIECSGIHKSYDERTQVLINVDFQLKKGEVRALIGSNGSGKTTLIKILSGVQKWQKGTITINGVKLQPKLDYASYELLRTSSTSVLSGETGLENGLNTYDFIKYWFVLSNIPFTEKVYGHMISTMKLLNMNIDVFLTKNIATYSRGMKQKVHILKSFLIEKDIVFMDEPFIGLDPHSTEAVMKTVRLERAKNRSFVVISHELTHLCSLADSVSFINSGKLQSAFSLNDMLNTYDAFELTYKVNEDFVYNIKILDYIEYFINYYLTTYCNDNNVYHLSYKVVGANLFSLFIVAKKTDISEITEKMITMLKQMLVKKNFEIDNVGYRQGLTFEIFGIMSAKTIL